MKNAKLIASVVLILFLTILLGCSKPAGPVPKIEDVVGKWVAIKKEAYILGGGHHLGFVIEFSGDKTVVLPSGKGTWEIGPDGRLKINIGALTMLGALQGKKLTITMPDNRGKVIFQKQ